jgi:hypothetical protein
MKILQGVEYRKEAREHKILQKKMLQHSQRSIFQKFFPTLAHF